LNKHNKHNQTRISVTSACVAGMQNGGHRKYGLARTGSGDCKIECRDGNYQIYRVSELGRISVPLLVVRLSGSGRGAIPVTDGGAGYDSSLLVAGPGRQNGDRYRDYSERVT
jgi:hypothetical protein